MTADQLNKHRSQVSLGNLANIQSVLKEIGEDLLFISQLDPAYYVELDIFLRELHKTIYHNAQREKYTSDLQELFKIICAKATSAAERAHDEKKGEAFYLEVQNLGQILIDIAPNLSVIIGLISLLNPEFSFLR